MQSLPEIRKRNIPVLHAQMRKTKIPYLPTSVPILRIVDLQRIPNIYVVGKLYNM